MPKQARTLEEAIRRVKNFIDFRKGDEANITDMRIDCEIPVNPQWPRQATFRATIRVPLSDVRNTSISIEGNGLTPGDERELETMLYRFMTED